jgi:hypothetical protein
VITPHGAAARRAGLRPLAFVGAIVIASAVIGGLAAWLLHPSPSLPASRLIGWRLADGFLGTPRFDPTTAATTMVVAISVDWLSCAPQDDSWLGPPEVSYTPSSVTITVHTTDAFARVTTCGGGGGDRGAISIMLDVGIPIAVRLSEPLRGRALLDGAGSPATARPYR